MRALPRWLTLTLPERLRLRADTLRKRALQVLARAYTQSAGLNARARALDDKADQLELSAGSLTPSRSPPAS